MSSNRKHYPYADSMRGIAILMVLLYHSVLVYPVNLVENYAFCEILHSFLWAVEMPVFFYVSGFCLSYTGGYASYLKKKTLRILVPHLVFGLLDVLVRLFAGGFVSSQAGLKDGILDFVLTGGSDWFLLTLFWMMLVAPLFVRLVRSGPAGRYALFIASLLLYLFQNRIGGLLCARNVVIFLPFFILGMLFRYKKDKDDAKEESRGKAWICFLVTLCLGCLLFALMRWDGFMGQEKDWLPLFGEGSFMMQVREVLTKELWHGLDIRWIKLIYLSGILLSQICLIKAVYYLCTRIKGSSILQKGLYAFSKYSLQLYLLDGYALVLTRTLCVSVLHLSSPTLLISINYILDTLITYLIASRILTRFKVFRLLTGLPQKVTE